MKMLISKTELDSKKSRELIPLECTHCGTTHHRTKSMVLRVLNGKLKGTNKGCYCSKKCGYEHRQLSKEYTCTECKNPTSRTPSQIRGKKIFCSSSCAATHYNKSRIIWKKCLFCQKEFHPKRGSKGIYCSSLCSSKQKRKETFDKIENGTYKINHYSLSIIRAYLIEKRGKKCERCKNERWMRLPINLTVNHINGNAENHHPSNIELLCWNCHSMTPTFGGKNKGKGREKRKLIYQTGKIGAT